MSEKKYESTVGHILADVNIVYRVLSNLESVNKVKHLIPPEQMAKVQDLEITSDYIRIKVDGIGQKICLRIVDREENSTIKFGIDDKPMGVDGNFWIQLKGLSSTDTAVKLTLKLDVPFMLKALLPDKKISDGLNEAVKRLAEFPFAALEQI